MIQAQRNYVYGSAAPKLEQPFSEEKQNQVVAPKSKPKAKAKKAKRSKIKPLFILVACIGVSLTILYRYALITEMNNKEMLVRANYVEMKQQNEKLKYDIQCGIDLAQVEQTAKEKLGMQKPDKQQIVYIRVPKMNKTVVADTTTGNAGAGSSMLGNAWMNQLVHLGGFLD